MENGGGMEDVREVGKLRVVGLVKGCGWMCLMDEVVFMAMHICPRRLWRRWPLLIHLSVSNRRSYSVSLSFVSVFNCTQT